MKIAGRDSNRVCVIVEKVDDNYVVVDGDTRRRKVNVAHIEPTAKVLKISEKADTAIVRKALEDDGFKLHVKGEPRKAKPKQVKAGKKKSSEKPAKKASKKEGEKPAPKVEKPVAKEPVAKKETPKAE